MANLARSVISRGRGPTLEHEREQFLRTQWNAITKALSAQEGPTKLKHVRIIIIGTHQERSGGLFWENVQRIPIHGNQIVAWKLCHVLHKLLRDGHARALWDSVKRREFLKNMSFTMASIDVGYGKLINSYVNLLLVKLNFHERNKAFPGNLFVSDAQLESMAHDDVNNFFQLTVEMFDYLEEILKLQKMVFGSLDMSRANSMTASGQCRLAPLIPCIQDSSHLYDYIVKIMFKLHSRLPPDTLTGHRDRFKRQFEELKAFYDHSRDLQYFKNLIQVPSLPARPLNFLIEAERRTYVTPVVKVPDLPQEEEEGTLIDMAPLGQAAGLDLLADGAFGSLQTNGSAASAEALAEKERQIEFLEAQLSDAKSQLSQTTYELQRDVRDSREESASLKNKLSNKEVEVRALTETNRDLLSKLTQDRTDSSVEKLQLTERALREQENKFVKLREVYTKRRDEHVELLRAKAEVDKKLASVSERMQQQDGQLRAQLEAALAQIEELKAELRRVTAERDGLLAAQERSREVALASEKAAAEQTAAAFLATCIRECSKQLRDVIAFCTGPSQTSLTCQPEHLLTLVEPCLSALTLVEQKLGSSGTSGQTDDVVGALWHVTRHVAGLAIQGKAASNCSPDIDKGDRMGMASVESAEEMLRLLEAIQAGVGAVDPTRRQVEKVRELGQDLAQCLRGADNKPAADVDEELKNMDKLIEDAAARIAAMLAQSRVADTGLRLEVNGKILDSCTDLMAAIRNLVVKARVLQAEIVSQGKGTVSAAEFYKRNHRWTEGLLSAAKMVGNGAKYLVDAADKVVSGQAKLEEVIVASQEIAASTVQLVVASRVKAAPMSANLAELSAASKRVSQATGTVVATATSCIELIEDKDVLDVSRLSLHQTKRQEMDSQVRVLSLEKELGKERERLAALRRHHYSTAGELEGWDEDVSSAADANHAALSNE